MNTQPPAEVGMKVDEVDTPALLVDLDILEQNLQRMADELARTPVRLRAHAKTHKCPEVARRQIELGAIGLCCQKVSEAEAMVDGGIRDILISNEIVGPRKLERLARLAQRSRVMVCVDDPDQVNVLNQVMQDHQVHLQVLVEIEVGGTKCGVPPGQPAVDLARRIDVATHLDFTGLQSYFGAAQHLVDFSQRSAAVAKSQSLTRELIGTLAQHGLACPVVSGGGTGAYDLESASGVYTEIQAGSYVFMDHGYTNNLTADGKPCNQFQQSLFVYATVMSRPVPERAVVDAGWKAVGVDCGFPIVADRPDIEYFQGGDEHGKLRLHDPETQLRVGDKLRLVPGNCDPTVNLYDWYVLFRQRRVEAIWAITARGAVL